MLALRIYPKPSSKDYWCGIKFVLIVVQQIEEYQGLHLHPLGYFELCLDLFKRIFLKVFLMLKRTLIWIGDLVQLLLMTG